MRYLNKLATVLCSAALGVLAMTSCEGGDLYDVNSPDWVKEKIDSINSSKSSGEFVIPSGKEDVYTIGATDFSSGWWATFSKYYVVPKDGVWNAVFDLNINSDESTAYYKNFALIISNDNDRGTANYKEYGAIRFDATNDSATYNSQWGSDYYKLPFKYSESTLMLSPVSNIDKNIQKLGGKCVLTVDRSQAGKFVVTIRNSSGVTKTYTQPYELSNLNADESDTNIRCFLVPEGSYINFLQTDIDPIGGCTSAKDKEPVSMVLNNVPSDVQQGSSLDSVMISAGVSATVTFEEDMTKTVPAEELNFVAVPNMDELGEKTLVAIYDKTFKGESAAKPITAQATFRVVTEISKIEVVTQPTRTTYYSCVTPASQGLEGHIMPFDPTGLVVKATYANGVTEIIDNSKLSFGTVPSDPGVHSVTIFTDNDKTARVKVTVEESEVINATPSPLVLGAEDNSTGWWGAHLDSDINIPAGKTVKTSFTNYAGGSNWNNWVVVLRNAALGEYAVVRADNYGWGNGYDTTTTTLLSGGQADWTAWLAAMNGATCEVYVTNCNNTYADVQAVMHGTDGNTYYQYYLNIGTVDPSDLNLDFTVDSNHLVFNQLSSAKKSVRRARR